MISIRNYLKARKNETDVVFRQSIALLLQIIERHTVEGDDIEYAQFRKRIAHLSRRFSDMTPADEVVAIAGEVARAFQEYGQRTTCFVREQGVRYERVVNDLTEAVASTKQASDRAIERLRHVEKRLEKASVIEDVRLLRMRLTDCLDSIREEIACRETEAAESARRLEASIGAVTLPDRAGDAESQPAQESDFVTGLPGRMLAEEALVEGAQTEAPWFAVAIVPNRIAPINARFGHAVGDRVLRKVSEQLQSGLSAEDRVFRWNASGFVALLLRTVPEEEVRKEMLRVMSAQMEELITVGNRSVLLPISVNWSLFRINAPAHVIRSRIDDFVAAQISSF